MNARRVHMNEYVAPKAGTDGLQVFVQHTRMTLIGDKLVNTGTGAAEMSAEPGPFEVKDLGDRDRLSWAKAACAIPHDSLLMYWKHRFVAWFGGIEIGLADATRTNVVRLRCPLLTGDSKAAGVTKTDLWLFPRFDLPLIGFEIAELETLFDQPSGQLIIDVHEVYPRHRPRKVVSARVKKLTSKMVTFVTLDETELRISAVDGLEKGMTVKLHDERAPDQFAAIERPDGTSIEIELPPAQIGFAASLVNEEALDPLGGVTTTKGEPVLREVDLARLFIELVDEPHEATPSVLVDLLQDCGAEGATELARLLAGEVVDALGLLAKYLEVTESRLGLPCAAQLRDAAPLDEEIGDVVTSDHRLGLFHTLHIGGGPANVYAKLISSPRAVALRHIDVPSRHILAALIAAKRTTITQFSNVRFATKEVSQLLADPTFDRVARLHTTTTPQVVEAQLAFWTRDEFGFWKRAPRHLILTNRDGNDGELLTAVRAAWDKLPVASITAGALTLRR